MISYVLDLSPFQNKKRIHNAFQLKDIYVECRYSFAYLI